MSDARQFIEGMDRNQQHAARSHLYEVMEPYALVPMCEYGWNRNDGMGFSIFRGHQSRRGTCKVCQKRRAAGLPAISVSKGHQTQWI